MVWVRVRVKVRVRVRVWLWVRVSVGFWVRLRVRFRARVRVWVRVRVRFRVMVRLRVSVRVRVIVPLVAGSSVSVVEVSASGLDEVPINETRVSYYPSFSILLVSSLFVYLSEFHQIQQHFFVIFACLLSQCIYNRILCLFFLQWQGRLSSSIKGGGGGNGALLKLRFGCQQAMAKYFLVCAIGKGLLHYAFNIEV